LKQDKIYDEKLTKKKDSISESRKGWAEYALKKDKNDQIELKKQRAIESFFKIASAYVGTKVLEMDLNEVNEFQQQYRDKIA